ncbi:uncharacterized protein LOC134820282 isoform X4 [Bolinopsis microptera]|uniref:uncharacterized protein LOC134820282 isoform X4 n=1 Tax=Bolinopsis microptera TaxID=2820187 RepID=UPI003079101F
MLGVSQQQSTSVLGGVGPNISSNAGTLGESCSDMSALTSVFKGLSPDQPQTPGKTKITVGESINQRCDLMLSEQLSHLQDIQSALEENLDIIETEAYTDPEKYIARAQNLFEQAQNGSVLVACIGKMQTELLHTRQDLQKLIASSDRDPQDALTRAQDRVKWLENRIEQVLLLHRQSVLEGKRAKMTSSLAHSSKYGSSSSDLKSGSSGEKVEESVYNMVSLGPLPFTDESIGREDTTVTTKSVKSTKSIKSQKSKAASTATTRFTVPSARSEDNPESSLWSKKSGPQPLWHTLPLVPRSPITLSCTPFDRNVPWLDRRGSSYDLLCFQREEYNQLMDKVAKVYTHIQYVVDSSHETDVNINSPTNVSSRMSRQGGDGKDDYDCYGLDPPVPLKWGRLSRSQSNIYPRPTRTWHNGIYLEPVRRIANQQQNQQGSMSRQSTFASGGKSESIRIFSRSKLIQAKRRVLASVSLQKLNRITLAKRNNNELSSGVTAAQKKRIMFLINQNLKSEIAKVRKEAVRDLGILYKTQQEFAVVNALKETVYTDDNIFVLIEASKSLLSIGVWDCAALEIVLQAIKYGSQGLRFTLLEALRTSSNPNSVNKQSVQFRVLQGLLLNLIRRGSHIPQTEESKGPTFTLPTDTPSLLLKLQKEIKT